MIFIKMLLYLSYQIKKNHFNIELISDKINEFKIGDQYFINFKNDERLKKLDASGFLEKIYESQRLKTIFKT